MNKWYKYLTKKHNYEIYNCLHMIEEIYKDHLGIDFSKEYAKIDMDAKTLGQHGRRFSLKINLDFMKNALSDHIQVELNNIQEYDLIIFISTKNRLTHFGLYIGINKYIHLPEGGYTNIKELGQEERDSIYRIYRHKNVV